MNDKINSYGNIQSLVETLKADYAAISELKGKISGGNISEAAQIYLMDVLGYTQLQAEEVVEDLKKGLDNYAAQRKAIEEDENALEANIKNSLSGYSPQERMEILVNILTAFQLTDPSNSEKDVESLRSDNLSLSEDELIQAIINSLGGLPFTAVIETVGKEFDTTALASLEEMREIMSDEYKLTAALQIYIAQQQGKLNLSNNGMQLSPEIIGGMTGASIDAIIATNDLQNNRIDLKKWQRILKYIMGALFIITLSAISAMAILSIGLGIIYLTFSVFGTGILATILCGIALAAFCIWACQIQEKSAEYLMDKMSKVYNKAIVRLTELVNNLRDKIKAYLNKDKASATENAETEGNQQNADTTDRQENELDSDIPGAPALA